MTARAPAVRRFALVAIILPAVLVGLSLVVQLAVLPLLPDPVAMHWGGHGEPDGFAPAWTNLVLTVVVGLGMPLLIAASVLGGLRRGDRGFAYRFLGAVALGLSTLMAVLGGGGLVIQAGLADAADGPSVLPVVATAFAASVIAGAAGWLLQPHEPFVASPPLEEPRIVLTATEQVVWVQRTQIARSGAIVLGAVLLLMVVMTVLSLVFVADPVATLVLAVSTVALAGLVATAVAFHVRVDAAGLSATSAVGFPRVHIPMEEVAADSAVTVQPCAEFGGWGLRWVPGGVSGVVLRAGPGIRVARTDGRVFVVTVEDAATGAALLEALRSRGDAPAAPPAA